MRFFANLVIAAIVLASAQAAEFHVAPDGSDGNRGRADAPFATVERARDAVRAFAEKRPLPGGGATVWVHGGDYYFDKSFRLGPEDSGDFGRPVHYRAAEGESPRFIGGRSIPAGSFRPVTDEVRERLPEAARDTTLQADLHALGITELGAFPGQYVEPPAVPELFFDDRRMTLARWPNEGWAEIAEVVESGPAPWRSHASDETGTFVYSGERPERWLSAPGVWLLGYWCFDWASDTIKVGSIDPAAKQITLSTPHHYGIGSGNPAPRRYRALNLLEELDMPGEYFIDRASGTLYFWPPGELDGVRIVLSTRTEPLITLDNVSYVTLQGLTVEMTAGNGIEVHGGRDVRIAGCTVRNTGHDAVVVDEGNDHLVVACDLYDTGTGGLRMSGGDRKSLTPSGHQAINNHIYDVSQRRLTHAYHVHLNGVGVRLAHNYLHDAPHQSIGLGGNDHLIEYNEIARVGMASDDCGAFYMGRNPSERGNVIRYNYWRDIGSSFAHGSCAVYFDDGTGGQAVFGNVFYRAAGGNFGAVFVHGGHDNWVENNIFIECKRALGHAPWDDARWAEWLQGDLWHTRLREQVDVTQPPYTDRYPGLEDFMNPEPKARMNRAYRNLIVRCESATSGDWELQDNWITDADPGFVSLANQDFTLRADAAAYEEIPDFEPVPFEEMGLFVDELRPSLPSRQAP